jgi:hypothetical protein
MADIVRQPPWRWAVVLTMVVLAVLAARAGRAMHERSQPTSPSAPGLVVVGGVDHRRLTATDDAALTAHRDTAQVGAVSVRGWSRSDCPTAGWATLGAGSSAVVDGPCTLPSVVDGRVDGWAELKVEQLAHSADARLGRLGGSAKGCITAVGPGAAIAAARPDGTVERTQTVTSFLQSGGATPCRLTIVDAGSDSDPVVRLLADRPDLTVIVVGVASAPGAPNPGLQLIYRWSARPSGWLTSTSTRRPGLVTLADLTSTLADFAGSPPSSSGGVALRVRPARFTPAEAQTRLDGLAARSSNVLNAELIVAVIAVLAGVPALFPWVRRGSTARSVLTAAVLVLPLTMTLAGLIQWWRMKPPELALVLLVSTGFLGWAASAFARARRLPVAVVATGGITAVLALDAVSGGLLQEGSLLNPQGLDGGRWYGFGNLTFAIYACSGLLLTGYLAHHYRAAGRPRLAAVAPAVLAGVLLLTDGWPSMGADFGGVLALGPPLIGLLLVVSERTLNWLRIAVVTGGGMVLAALIAVLDWARGPARRTHIGNFVQRLLDADGGGLLTRKAAAVAQTVATPWGLASLAIGGLLWVLVHRKLRHPVPTHFPTIVPVAWAALTTAVLGTALNDSGVLVWVAITVSFVLTASAVHAEDPGEVRGDGRLQDAQRSF